MMEKQSFRKSRNLWRSEFQFSVMAENHVFQQEPEFRRKIGQVPHFLVHYA